MNVDGKDGKKFERIAEKVELHRMSLGGEGQRMGRDNWKSKYFNSLKRKEGGWGKGEDKTGTVPGGDGADCFVDTTRGLLVITSAAVFRPGSGASTHCRKTGGFGRAQRPSRSQGGSQLAGPPSREGSGCRRR